MIDHLSALYCSLSLNLPAYCFRLQIYSTLAEAIWFGFRKSYDGGGGVFYWTFPNQRNEEWRKQHFYCSASCYISMCCIWGWTVISGRAVRLFCEVKITAAETFCCYVRSFKGLLVSLKKKKKKRIIRFQRVCTFRAGVTSLCHNSK